jgi:hypothetical protein
MCIEHGKAIPSNELGLGIAWDFDEIDRCVVDGSRAMIS